MNQQREKNMTERKKLFSGGVWIFFKFQGGGVDLKGGGWSTLIFMGISFILQTPMYESSGLQFFWITTKVQSGLEIFVESRWLKTNLRVKATFSERFVLEGKVDK